MALLENQLTEADVRAMKEEELLKKVILPVFQALGYHDAYLNHGNAESGKDIVGSKDEPDGSAHNLAVVAKASKLTGDPVQRKVIQQITRSINTPFRSRADNSPRDVNLVYVVTNTEIAQQTIDQILDSFENPLLKKLIRFRDIAWLWSQYQKYYGAHPIGGLKITPSEPCASDVNSPPNASDVPVPDSASATSGSLGTNQIADKTSADVAQQWLELPADLDWLVGAYEAEASSDDEAKQVPGQSRAATLIEIPVRLRLYCDDGDFAEIEYLAFGMSLQEGGVIRLSNGRQSLPILVSVVLKPQQGTASIEFEIRRGVTAASWIRRWQDVSRCFLKTGFTELAQNVTGERIVWSRRENQDAGPTASAEARRAIEDLELLERIIGSPIYLPEQSDPESANTVQQLRNILTNQHFTGTWGSVDLTLSESTVPPDLMFLLDGSSHEFFLEYSASIRLGDQVVRLGRAHYWLESARIENLPTVLEFLDGPHSPSRVVTATLVPGENNRLIGLYYDLLANKPVVLNRRVEN